MFDRLEQIDQCVVVVNAALDRLICLDVTKMRAYGLKEGTYRE